MERSPDKCAVVGVEVMGGGQDGKSFKDSEMDPTLDMGYHQRKPIPDKCHQVRTFLYFFSSSALPNPFWRGQKQWLARKRQGQGERGRSEGWRTMDKMALSLWQVSSKWQARKVE